MSYAKGTEVPVRRSRMEIEDILGRARARASYTAMEEGRVDFARKERRGYTVATTKEEQDRLWEQACRERWRALVLALKAKFVSVEAGVETIEEAFLAHVVLANRQTVHRWFKAQLEKASPGGPMLLESGVAP